MGGNVNAVVDHLLRRGEIEGLRLANASVMRRLPSCNTNAPTIMIAEKADMVLCNESQLTREETA